MSELNGYNLSRQWFDFCFENPEKIRPVHTAIYMFAVEHWNRLGQKKKFGFPSQMTMDAIGVKSYNTYIPAFRDLVKWGFFELIEKSQNQYSSNIIALLKIDKAPDKSLDKAFAKHLTNHLQTKCSIDKPLNNRTIEPLNTTRVCGCPIPDDLQIEGFKERYKSYWQYMKDTRNKRPSLQAVESHFRRLIELKQDGHNPLKVIDQTISAGNKSFYPLKDHEFNQTENGKDNAVKNAVKAVEAINWEN